MKEIQPQQIWNEEKMEGVKKLIQKQKLIDMMEQDEQLGLYQETPEESCCTPVGQIKRYVDCKGCDRKPKQETLEEVAERFTQLWFKNNSITKELFIEGAKWQQENIPICIYAENIYCILDILNLHQKM